MTRVFPEPAPAKMRSGPSPCCTASCWGGLRSVRIGSSIMGNWFLGGKRSAFNSQQSAEEKKGGTGEHLSDTSYACALAVSSCRRMRAGRHGGRIIDQRVGGKNTKTPDASRRTRGFQTRGSSGNPAPCRLCASRSDGWRHSRIPVPRSGHGRAAAACGLVLAITTASVPGRRGLCADRRLSCSA